MKRFIFIFLVLLIGCTTPAERHQHSQKFIENIMSEKLKNYNEVTDGKIYGVNLLDIGNQGMTFQNIDPATGAKIYSKKEYQEGSKILTNIYLDDFGRVIQLDRYWIGFSRLDLLAISKAQEKYFEKNYSIKLSSLNLFTDPLHERKLVTKESYMNKLQKDSEICNANCTSFTPSKKGISRIISFAGNFGWFIESDPSRFFRVTLETHFMNEYKTLKNNKYENSAGR